MYRPEECCQHGTPFDYTCQACIDEDRMLEVKAELMHGEADGDNLDEMEEE